MRKSFILFCMFGSLFMLSAQSNSDIQCTESITNVKELLANNSKDQYGENVKIKTERFVKPNTEHLATCGFDMPVDGFIDLDFHYGGSEAHKEAELELAILYYAGYYFTVHDLDDSHNISIKGIPCSAGRHYLDMQSNTLYVESTVTVTMYKKSGYY